MSWSSASSLRSSFTATGPPSRGAGRPTRPPVAPRPDLAVSRYRLPRGSSVRRGDRRRRAAVVGERRAAPRGRPDRRPRRRRSRAAPSRTRTRAQRAGLGRRRPRPGTDPVIRRRPRPRLDPRPGRAGAGCPAAAAPPVACSGGGAPTRPWAASAASPLAIARRPSSNRRRPGVPSAVTRPAPAPGRAGPRRPPRDRPAAPPGRDRRRQQRLELGLSTRQPAPVGRVERGGDQQYPHRQPVGDRGRAATAGCRRWR